MTDNNDSVCVLDVEVNSDGSLLAAVAVVLLDDLRGPVNYSFDELNAMEGRVVRFTNVGRNVKIELLPVEE